MIKKISAFLILACAINFSGCGEKNSIPSAPSGEKRASDSLSVSSSLPSQVSTVESGTQRPAVRLSPLEYAQQEYLDAYNDYVKLLRESGPQTIETLQALTIYQKKYQIYQMLLKAEGDKKP